MSTILVVDDLLTDRRIAGGLLAQGDDFNVVYATNGKDALEKIEHDCPDLVLTDLMMPEMNGLKLVETIREQYPLIPTVLMTAKGSEDIAVQAIQRGAASYVPKKHLNADLLETVWRVLAASLEVRSRARLMNSAAETTFVLENDLDLLSSLVSYVRQAVHERKICAENDAMRVASGLDEALLNAYYHGNLEISSDIKAEDHEKYHQLSLERRGEHPYCDRRITVTTRFSAESVTFVVRDEGSGFNPDDLPDPTDPDYLEQPSGRGLLLMRAFMDEVTFNEMGNEVTMVKRKPVAVPVETNEDDDQITVSF